MAEKAGEVYIEVTARDDDVQEKLEEAEKRAKETGESFSNMGDDAEEGFGKAEESAGRMSDAVDEGASTVEEGANRMGVSVLGFARVVNERFRNVSDRFREMGENMVDTADNLTQALSLPFALIGAAIMNALQETDAGKAAYERFQKAVKKVNEALVPLGKIVLDIALQYLPPLIDAIKQATQWFKNLSPQMQKMIVGFGAFTMAIGPVIAFVGALILGFGSLATMMATVLSPMGLLVIGLGSLLAHAIQASGGFVAFGQTLLNLGRYFAAVVEDADVLNDWLTHLPAGARGAAQGVAQAFVDMRNRVREIIRGFKQEIAPQFSTIWKTLVASIKTGDPQMIGVSLAEFINKGVQILPQLLAKINWHGLAQGIIKAINNVTIGLSAFVGAVNWGGIIDFIGKGIERTIAFVGKLIPPLMHLFTEVFNRIPWEQVAGHVAANAGRITNAILNVFQAIVNNIDYGRVISIAVTFALNVVSALFDPTVWLKVIEDNWLQIVLLAFTPTRLFKPIVNVLSRIPLAGKIGATILEQIHKLGGPMRGKIGEKIGEWFGKVKDKAADKLKDLGGKLKQKINDALVKALGGHDGKWSTVVEHWKTTALNTLKDWGGKLKTKISNGIKNGISGFENRFSNMAGKWKDKLLSPFKKLNFKSLVQKAIDAIRNIHVPHIPVPHFYTSGSFKLGPVSLPKIGVKWYATGGVFNGPSVIGVGEAGPEAVVPLSGPRMRPFAQAIAKELGGIGGHNITVYNYTNDKRVGYDIARAIDRELWKHAF